MVTPVDRNTGRFAIWRSTYPFVYAEARARVAKSSDVHASCSKRICLRCRARDASQGASLGYAGSQPSSNRLSSESRAALAAMTTDERHRSQIPGLEPGLSANHGGPLRYSRSMGRQARGALDSRDASRRAGRQAKGRATPAARHSHRCLGASARAGSNVREARRRHADDRWRNDGLLCSVPARGGSNLSPSGGATSILIGSAALRDATRARRMHANSRGGSAAATEFGHCNLIDS